MRCVSDVVETAYVLSNHSHFLNRVKLGLLLYLLATSLIPQPCIAATLLPGDEASPSELSKKPSPALQPLPSNRPPSVPKFDPKKCRNYFVNLVKSRQEMCYKPSQPFIKDTGTQNIRVVSDSDELFKDELVNPVCGLPGYSVLQPFSNADSRLGWGIIKTSASGVNSVSSEEPSGFVSVHMSPEAVCDQLFGTSNDNSSSDLSLEEHLSSLRLPFCGAYNILLENKKYSYKYNRTLYNSCWGTQDLMLTLQDILVSESFAGPFLTASNCISVLLHLLKADYNASAKFYAQFVPSLARYDCRVLADYSVDAYCFSCAVAYRQWVCGTSLRPPEWLITSSENVTSGQGETGGGDDYSPPSKDQNFISSKSGSTATNQQSTTPLSPASSSFYPGATPSTQQPPPSLEKPCSHLCHNVQLHCPFLNPSLASGGRPVFSCPSITGDEYDTYSDDKRTCYNPYQNSSLNQVLLSLSSRHRRGAGNPNYASKSLQKKVWKAQKSKRSFAFPRTQNSIVLKSRDVFSEIVWLAISQWGQSYCNFTRFKTYIEPHQTTWKRFDSWKQKDSSWSWPEITSKPNQKTQRLLGVQIWNNLGEIADQIPLKTLGVTIHLVFYACSIRLLLWYPFR